MLPVTDAVCNEYTLTFEFAEVTETGDGPAVVLVPVKFA